MENYITGYDLKRYDYVPYRTRVEDRNENFFSTKNEPWFVNNEYGWYPDMAKMYDDFSKAFNIEKKNFILTNGCENAMRLALEFYNFKFGNQILYTENPGWKMADVLGAALGYEVHHYDYLYDGYSREFYPEQSFDPQSDLVYTTDIYNNLFKHGNLNMDAFYILDETYTMHQLMSGYEKPDQDIIVIGSFSKAYGPGYRLGYILFHEDHNDIFQLLREQYLSPAAGKLLKQFRRDDFAIDPLGSGIYSTEISDEYDGPPIVTAHPVYTTFQADAVPMPHKKFEISGIPFCRVGNTPNFLKMIHGGMA
jgi:hypothetical protein